MLNNSKEAIWLQQRSHKKGYCLIIDAMSIRKQTVWEPKNDRYGGFVDYGKGGPVLDDPDTLASEAHVFLLVGTRSHWNCPVGYFLTDKIESTTQAQLRQLWKWQLMQV